MLTDSLKQSIYMIDAFSMQKQYGTKYCEVCFDDKETIRQREKWHKNKEKYRKK